MIPSRCWRQCGLYIRWSMSADRLCTAQAGEGVRRIRVLSHGPGQE